MDNHTANWEREMDESTRRYWAMEKACEPFSTEALESGVLAEAVAALKGCADAIQKLNNTHPHQLQRMIVVLANTLNAEEIARTVLAKLEGN